MRVVPQENIICYRLYTHPRRLRHIMLRGGKKQPIYVPPSACWEENIRTVQPVYIDAAGLFPGIRFSADA